jgi:hypothetical protein
VEPALALLAKRADRLNAAAAMELVPGNTAIAKVLPFLKAVLSRNRQSFRDGQVGSAVGKRV